MANHLEQGHMLKRRRKGPVSIPSSSPPNQKSILRVTENKQNIFHLFSFTLLCKEATKIKLSPDTWFPGLESLLKMANSSDTGIEGRNLAQAS